MITRGGQKQQTIKIIILLKEEKKCVAKYASVFGHII